MAWGKKKEKFKKVELDDEELPDELVEDFEDAKPMTVRQIEKEEAKIQERLNKLEGSKMDELEELENRINNLRKEIQEEKTKPKERIEIVKELPMIPARSYTDEDGTVVKLYTLEEYWTLRANQK